MLNKLNCTADHKGASTSLHLIHFFHRFRQLLPLMWRSFTVPAAGFLLKSNLNKITSALASWVCESLLIAFIFWESAERARGRNQDVHHQHTHQQWCLPEHCAQPDVSPTGWREWDICQTGHWESGEKAEREKRRARLPHHSYHHQWSPSQQVCDHPEDTWWTAAGGIITIMIGSLI